MPNGNGELLPGPGPDLLPYQFEFGGLIFGDSTAILVENEVAGLFEAVMRVNDPRLPRADGAIPGPLYASATNIVLPLRVLAPPHSQGMHDILVAADTAFTTRLESWLRWRMAVVTWRRRVRVVRRVLTAEPVSARLGAYPYTVVLACADPRYYADASSTTSFGPYNPGAGGGYNLPTEIPIDTNIAPPGINQGVATNEGNETAWPIVRLDVRSGFVTRMELRNRSTGQSFIWDNGADPCYDLLTVNFDAYMRATGAPIITNDGANAYGGWQQPRDPFALPPGTSVLDVFTDPSQDVYCRVDWLSTFM